MLSAVITRPVLRCALLLVVASLSLTAAHPARAEDPTLEEAIPYDPSQEIGRMPMRMPVMRPPLGLALRDDAGLIDVRGLQTLFVGTLVAAEPGHPGAPADYCLDDGKLWAGADFRMGDMPVFGLPKTKTLSDAAGDTFMIAGERAVSIDDRIKEVGPCPEGYGEPWRMMQWRDDWTAPEGSNLRFEGPGKPTTKPWSHARLKTLPYLEATEAEPLRVIHTEVVEKKGGSVVSVTVHNVFNAPLTLPVVLHYEGGPGKPTPHYEEVAVSIPPGERHTFTAPLIRSDEDPATKRGRRGEHRLQTVELRGTLERATFDIAQAVR